MTCSNNAGSWAFIDDMIGSFDGSGGSCWGRRRRSDCHGGCFVFGVLN